MKVKKKINSFVDGNISEDVILNEKFTLFFEKNTDYDKYKYYKFPDGFLYFRYFMEIEFKIKTDEISIINRLLNWFWSNGLPAIAVYEKENELIEKGGYKSINIPFPKKNIFW